MARPFVPRADVVARVVAERAQRSAPRSPSASRCGSTRRSRRPARAEQLGRDRAGVELHQSGDVEVARARDVALARVARLAERCRRTRAAVRTSTTATSPSRAASSSSVDLAHSARTTSTSAATDGRCSSSSSHAASSRRQRDAEHVARAGSPTARRRCPRRGSAPLRAPSSLAASSFGVAAAEGVVVVAEILVEAVDEEPRPRALAPDRPGAAVVRGWRSSRYSMITSDSGSTKPSSRTGTRPRAGSARISQAGGRSGRPRRSRGRRPSRRARCARARSTGSGERRSASRLEPHQLRDLLVELVRRRQVGGRLRGPRDAPHLVAVGAGQARDERRVRSERELVALRRARRRSVGTERYSSTIRPRS